MDRIKFIFSEYPFLPIALIIFVLIGAVGIVKESSVWLGLGIGLTTSLVFVGILLLVTWLFFIGIHSFSQHNHLQTKENGGHSKRFIVGTLAFVVAIAVFTGGKYGLIVGAVFVAMVVCAYFLVKKEFS